MAREPLELDVPGPQAVPGEEDTPLAVESSSDGFQADLDLDQPTESSPEAKVLPDESESGRVLAENMVESGYQPIILFGNAYSGKTALILSLLSTIRTETKLESALVLGQPIMDTSKTYGSFLWGEAQKFFGLKTQQFIKGTGAVIEHGPLRDGFSGVYRHATDTIGMKPRETFES